MQPINFILSYLSICDNFTGLVEFMPAAALGYYSWRTHQQQSTIDASKSHHNIVSIQTLATFALLLWSLRLGTFLIYRMRKRPAVDSRLGEGKDRRKNRNSMLKILQFWLIHGTWGLVCSLPVSLLNSESNHNIILHSSAAEKEHVDEPTTFKVYQRSSEITLIQSIGLLIWLIGFVIEALADDTKLRNYNRLFSNQVDFQKHDDEYYRMNGHFLWKYSRNPNFFGECLCWLGLAIAAANEFYPDTNFSSFNFRYSSQSVANIKFLACWLSPMLTLAIMLGEAVLLSEWKNNRRYRKIVEDKDSTSKRMKYDEYKSQTSLLIPCHPILYKSCPKMIRRIFLFDWEIYEKLRDPSTLILHKDRRSKQD